MALIKVDPDKLRSTAASFQSTGGQVKNLTGQMTTLVNSLSGQVWDGSAASSYRSKFSGLNDDIQRISKMIDEHVSDLQEMASIVSNVDPEINQEINALSSDVIV